LLVAKHIIAWITKEKREVVPFLHILIMALAENTVTNTANIVYIITSR
jgi:hypothetical protein